MNPRILGNIDCLLSEPMLDCVALLSFGYLFVMDDLLKRV